MPGIKTTKINLNFTTIDRDNLMSIKGGKYATVVFNSDDVSKNRVLEDLNNRTDFDRRALRTLFRAIVHSKSVEVLHIRDIDLSTAPPDIMGALFTMIQNSMSLKEINFWNTNSAALTENAKLEMINALRYNVDIQKFKILTGRPGDQQFSATKKFMAEVNKYLNRNVKISSQLEALTKAKKVLMKSAIETQMKKQSSGSLIQRAKDKLWPKGSFFTASFPGEPKLMEIL